MAGEQNILYVAYVVQAWDDERSPVAKIGITTNLADPRIRQLNSTLQPFDVVLKGAWVFDESPISAFDAEKAAHELLAPLRVKGEWFEDPDENLADRIDQYARRLGAKRHQDDGDEESHELSDKQAQALAQMRNTFEPIRAKLAEFEINWEYMTWKVGMDSSFGRLNIEVRKNGSLYVRNESREQDATELTQISGISWRQGSQSRCFASMTCSSRDLI